MSDYPSMSHVQHITFEGNDCVVMSPEEYGAALADLEAKDYELSALRAELTEARRQLKEASEQEPMFWYVPALSDDDEDALVLPARDGKCPSSYQTASAIPLYAAPVPQPAVKVGDSFFESWYSLYNPEGKSTKQTMREAYAAGLVDREGRTDWQPAVPEAVVKDVERLDWLVSECAVVQSLAISPPHGDGTTRYYICWPEYGEEQIDTYATAREAIDAAILSATDSEVKK